MKTENTPTTKELSEIRTPEDLFKITAEENLNLAQLKTLIEMHPGIVQASIQAMQSLTKISETAVKTQTEALTTLRESVLGTIEVIKILANNAESDSAREKIAEALIELSKQHLRLSRAIERMSKNNNKIWEKLIFGTTTVIALVASGAAVAAYKLKK